MRSLLVLVLLAVPLAAQERTHSVVPADYFSLNSITEIAVSPDGKQVAYTLAVWDKAEDGRKSDLWVIGTDGKGKPTRLTFDRANDRHLRWSADSKAIYSLANRKRAAETKAPFDGTTQVWRIDATGGDSKAITREAGGVTGYDYAPKAEVIVFGKEKEHHDADEFAALRAKTKVEYGHGVRKVSELHQLDLTTWRTEKLVDDTRYVREFTVTQDGKKIAMVTALDDTVVKSEGESRMDVWVRSEPEASAKGSITTPQTDSYRKNPKNSPYAWLEGLTWNADGTQFAFCAIHDAYPSEIIRVRSYKDSWEVNIHNRKMWDKRELHVRGYGTQLKLFTQGLSYIAEVDGSTGTVSDNDSIANIAHRISSGEVVFSEGGEGDSGIISLVSTGKALQYLRQIPASKDGNGIARTLVNPNPHTATWKLPSVQHITWKAPDGSTVGGVLELPPGYKKGDKLPLVVAIHGGPTTSTKADLNFDPHNGRLYFATAGYAVLLPNYRGSTGYGDKFVTDLIGNENDIEVKDILAGIQHLVKEGIADENRVGCMGWSNGGYLTNCLITLKNSPIKFKAASSGAGIVDTVAEWGFNDEPAYPIVFKKGLPWEQPDLYRKTSPTYGLGNVTTPTLVHVGGGDERCPPGHSRMLYRALKENLKVPTELVVYTGEPHGLTKYSNRLAKMEWDLAWFEKYLKNAK
jgi:dipeptidyl aminopeptidase/acylaminoacyl peptidase